MASVVIHIQRLPHRSEKTDPPHEGWRWCIHQSDHQPQKSLFEGMEPTRKRAENVAIEFVNALGFAVTSIQ